MTQEILNEIFQNRTPLYNLRTNSSFAVRPVHSVYHGTESLSFLGPKIWELVPEDENSQRVLKFLKSRLNSGYLRDVLVDYAVFIFKKSVSFH